MDGKVCSNCVMDESDPEISFDEDGVCNHCITFEEETKKHWFPNEEGAQKLSGLVQRIKNEGQGKEYDCILGLSGGVDSSYLALKASEWDLRPLVVHVDAGWNSELAVANIEVILKHCKYDLHTHVVDWNDMRDLQLAYLKSGISNQDVPQDHIFFSTLNHFAISNGIRYFLSGGNFATEAIFPKSWHGSNMDSTNLKAIHKKYGTGKFSNYKTISFFEYYVWYPLFRKMRTIRPLNYMPYDKAQALLELEQTIGYKPYSRKHGESLFTKLFQNHLLPEKYGYDKRRPHLSSLIVSGQISRDEALEKLAEPLYDANELQRDIAYFCKKLRISRDQFEEFMKVPNCSYKDFPNWNFRYKLLKRLKNALDTLIGRKIALGH
jgi:aminotransferase